MYADGQVRVSRRTLTRQDGGHKFSDLLCVVVLFDVNLNVFPVGFGVIGIYSAEFSHGP